MTPSCIAICLLMLGTDYPYSEFLPHKATVIQVDERARVLGRRAPTALGVVGSVRPTVKLLLDRVEAEERRRILRSRDRRAQEVGRDAGQAVRSRRAASIAFIRKLWRAWSAILPRATRCSCSTPASTPYGRRNWIRQSGSQRIIGSFNNAAVGTALGQANGIAGARPLAPGHRAVRRRRFQYADVRIPHRRPSQAAGQSRGL